MKKSITIILNILSIISTLILTVFVVFCAYDWVRLASTDYAYTIDFWLVIDYYAVAMLIFSGAGLVFSIPNCFIATTEKSKKTAKILTGAFAAVIIISVILYFLPFSF